MRVVFEVCKAKIHPVTSINFHILVTIIYYERKKQQGVLVNLQRDNTNNHC